MHPGLMDLTDVYLEWQVGLVGDRRVLIAGGVVHRDAALCFLHEHHPQCCQQEGYPVDAQVGRILGG